MRDRDVAEVVHGHLEWWSGQETEQQLFEAMYETRFWKSHVYENGSWSLHNVDSEGGLPVKLEASRLWVWLNTFTSHLFLRQPRTVARLPGVLPPRAGRPRNLRELPERIEALVDEWLGRSEVQELATYAYQLALMGGAAAFKMGVDPASRTGDVLDRVWLTVCPRWECVWDDRAATPHQQLFRGHMTHVLDTEAERLVGQALPANWRRSRLPALFVPGVEDRTGPADGVHPERYVRLLEFYDFEEEQQKFFLVSPDATSPQLVPFGKPERIPYELPNGKPACPIFPVVLDNEPKHPMRGIPSARRVWRLTAEDNYLGSFVASAARQRMALKGAYNKAKLADDKMQAWWASPDNLELLGVEAGNLDDLVKFIEIPPLDSSLSDAKAWIDQSRRETEGISQQMQGQQGQYLTAREAELVAEGGEATSLQIAARMVGALGKAAEMLLVVVAAHEQKVSIVRGTLVANLTADQLRLPWRLRILDAGTTPSREAGRKREWGLVEPMVEKLVSLAAEGPEGAPVVPEALRRFARAGLRYTRQVYDLPEDFSPEALLDGVQKPDADEGSPEDLAETLLGSAMVPADGMAAPNMPMLPAPTPAPAPAAAPAGPAIIVDPQSGMAFDAASGAAIDPQTGALIPLPEEGMP